MKEYIRNKYLEFRNSMEEDDEMIMDNIHEFTNDLSRSELYELMEEFIK